MIIILDAYGYGIWAVLAQMWGGKNIHQVLQEDFFLSLSVTIPSQKSKVLLLSGALTNFKVLYEAVRSLW